MLFSLFNKIIDEEVRNFKAQTRKIGKSLNSQEKKRLSFDFEVIDKLIDKENCKF